MTYKPTSGVSEDTSGRKPDGLKGHGGQHSDLQDRRNGAFDRVTGKAPHTMKQHIKEHQAEQSGADVRAETEPADEGVPEGLRREQKHPLNPHSGRGETPAHVPAWRPKEE